MSQIDRRPLHRRTLASRVRHWLRYRSLFAVTLVILSVVGLANIYPFVWMTGTSLKSSSEAAQDRHIPMPVKKYSLAASTPVPGSATLSLSQRNLLDALAQNDAATREQGGTFVPMRMSVDQYAGKYGIGDAAAAEAELEQLVTLGLLRADLLQLENYEVVWSDMRFYLHAATSFVVTVTVVFLTVMSSSMLGYALARLSFPGKTLVVLLLLVSVVAPSEAMMVPVFHMLLSIGLLDGLWGMVLWMCGVGVGNALLMGGYFLTLPKEVEEAASIDGAGPFYTFFEIALPMARPILLTVSLFAFLSAWNNFMVPLICALSAPNLQPLAVAVYTFQQARAGDWQLTNAAAAIMTVPVILIFLSVQRHIVQSVAAGAVKG